MLTLLVIGAMCWCLNITQVGSSESSTSKLSRSLTTKFLGSPRTEWSKTYGGAYHDVAYSVVQTDDGGYALVGLTYSFGAEKWDLYLVKTDPNGTMQWNKTYGGAGWDVAYSLIQTADGGYALAGWTDSFGAGAWLVKTDSSGNMQWNKTYGGGEVYSLVQADDEGYVMAGGFAESNDSAVFWLVKADASGNMQWNKTYGNTEVAINVAYSLVKTHDGGYALAGTSRDWDMYSYGLLVKTDSAGNKQWNRSYSERSNDWVISMVQTSDGGYTMAGRTAFGDGPPDFWLIKTDESGKTEWTHTYGARDDSGAQSVIQTIDGGYAIVGSTYGDGDIDAWLVKTDPNGTMQWNKTYGGADADVGNSLIQTSDRGYAIAGKTGPSGEDSDFWLIKLKADQKEPFVEIVETKSEPWNLLYVPFGDIDEAKEYIENFEASPSPEDFGNIPVTVDISNTGDLSATGVSIDARMTGDVLMVVLDPADIRDDTAVSYQFDYTESVFTGGTIGMGDEITEKLILPIKYCSLVVGAISLLDNMNVMMPLEIVVPMISVHVTLTIKGNFDDVEYEIPEDILGIGDPADLLKEWNYQLSRRVQEKEIQVLLETYYSHVLDLKPPVIDVNPNIPTGIHETTVNILPGTSKTVLTLKIGVGITFIGIALLPWGATTPIGGTLIAVGLAMIVLNNPPPGMGTVTIETASPEVNMTLEVVQSIPKNVQTIDHIVVEDGQTFHVITVSNSTILTFDFSKENKEINFFANGSSGTKGFCHITIPGDLLNGNFTAINSDITILNQNQTQASVYLEYDHPNTVVIVGTTVIREFPATMFLWVFMIMTLLAAAYIVFRMRGT